MIRGKQIKFIYHQNQNLKWNCGKQKKDICADLQDQIFELIQYSNLNSSVSIQFQYLLQLMNKDEPRTNQSQVVVIQIDFQGEGKHKFTLNFDTDERVLFDYDKIRKKILQEFKYIASGKDQIKIFINNFYKNINISIPIYNRKNFTYLITDMIGREINQISITVQKTGQLRRRKIRQSKVQVEFDSDGSIESVDNQEIKTALKLNTPVCQPYKDSAIVRCLFCHSSSRDREQMRRAGLFYGPFVGKRYAHLMCLLWCSDIYLNEDSELSGVVLAIRRTQKIQCSYCNQKGASFFCHTIKCQRAGHYRCAQDNGWYFNWSQYTSFCPKCTPLIKPNLNQSQQKSRSNPHSQIGLKPVEIEPNIIAKIQIIQL